MCLQTKILYSPHDVGIETISDGVFEFIQFDSNGNWPCPVQMKTAGVTKSFEVPQTDSSPIGENWVSAMTQADYLENYSNTNCSVGSATFTVEYK